MDGGDMYPSEGRHTALPARTEGAASAEAGGKPKGMTAQWKEDQAQGHKACQGATPTCTCPATEPSFCQLNTQRA